MLSPRKDLSRAPYSYPVGDALTSPATSAPSFTVDDALDKIGFGRYQIKMMIVLAVLGVADCLEIMLLSVLSPVLRCEWGVSEVQIAMVSTVVFVGMFLGGPVWGKMSDRYGRWPTLWVVMCLTGVFGMMTAFAPTYGWLLFLRGLVGAAAVGTGQAFILLAEMLPPKHRGKLLVITQLFWACGTFTLIAAAAVIIPNFGWRYLIGFVAVFSILSLLLFRMVPESPRFLLGKGRHATALAQLKEIARANGGQLPEGNLVMPTSKEAGKIADMFQPGYLRLTIQLFVTWLTMTFGYYGVVLGSTEIVERARICDIYGNVVDQHEAAAVASCGCRPLSSDDYVTLIIGTLGEFGSMAINIVTMDLIGRRWNFTMNLIGCAVFVSLLNVCTTRFVLSMFVLFGRMFMSAVGNTVYIYTSEVYPTNFRAVGLGVCSSISRFGSMISPLVAQVVLAYSIPWALGIYATVMLLTAINCVFLPVETKGRKLQETHEIIAH